MFKYSLFASGAVALLLGAAAVAIGADADTDFDFHNHASRSHVKIEVGPCDTAAGTRDVYVKTGSSIICGKAVQSSTAIPGIGPLGVADCTMAGAVSIMQFSVVLQCPDGTTVDATVNGDIVQKNNGLADPFGTWTIVKLDTNEVFDLAETGDTVKRNANGKSGK